ncbi:hypothetical protein DH09_08400 [Bacillaceae bacterium JMAK1]|nr:hypothetical protein DH09_08400 [Bacillaceae bacterium JMAK1]
MPLYIVTEVYEETVKIEVEAENAQEARRKSRIRKSQNRNNAPPEEIVVEKQYVTVQVKEEAN